MQQTSIRPLLAALTASAALSFTASAQGSAATDIPDCVLQCRPWLAELLSINCSQDCLGDEFEFELDLAAQSGDPYVPRFSFPGCVGTDPCEPGDEAFTYSVGDQVTLGFGLWGVSQDFWTGSSGSVIDTQLYVAPVASVVGAEDMKDLPWQLLSPPPTFSAITGFWRASIDTTSLDDPAGYFFRVDLTDSALGKINAFTMGSDVESCGIHGYGELVGGANKLDLTASGVACSGQSAVLTTTGTGAPLVFTSLSLGGDYFEILGGTLLVDVFQEFAVLSTPASGGVAVQPVVFPVNPALAGLSVFTQSIAIEPTADISFSDAQRITFCACP